MEKGFPNSATTIGTIEAKNPVVARRLLQKKLKEKGFPGGWPPADSPSVLIYGEIGYFNISAIADVDSKGFGERLRRIKKVLVPAKARKKKKKEEK